MVVATPLPQNDPILLTTTNLFLLFFLIGLFFLVAMVVLTMRLFQRTHGKPTWLKPIMILLLVLFFLSGPFNLLFFVIWIILLLTYWK